MPLSTKVGRSHLRNLGKSIQADHTVASGYLDEVDTFNERSSLRIEKRPIKAKVFWREA